MSDTIHLEYDLFTLPTAQHRAGLAGLVVVLQTMCGQHLPDLPGIQTDSGAVKVVISQKSLTALLNYIYQVTTQEIAQTTTRKDRDGKLIPPLRTDTRTTVDKRTGKQKTQRLYIYEQLRPKAPVLEALQMPEGWLKLWRDAVWSGLRAVPKTRTPYEERSLQKDVSEARRLWSELQRSIKEDSKGGAYVTDVAGSLLLGAQAANPDGVPFLGRPAENLLLHFWPFVMGVGESWETIVEGGELREKPSGYVIAVPDVANLDDFVDGFHGLTAGLDREMFAYRPKDAVLALPAEGGLQYLRNLSRLTHAQAKLSTIRFTVSGIELFQLVRKGKAVHLLGLERVPARRELAQKYELIRSGNPNLLFRMQQIRNLFDGSPWYRGFDRLFNTEDQRMFWSNGPRGFSANARRKFSDVGASS